MNPDEVLCALARALSVAPTLCDAFGAAADELAAAETALGRETAKAAHKPRHSFTDEVAVSRVARDAAAKRRDETRRPVAVALAGLLRVLAEGAP